MHILVIFTLIVYPIHVCESNDMIHPLDEYVIQTRSGALGAKRVAKCMGLEFAGGIDYVDLDGVYLLQTPTYKIATFRSHRLSRCARSPDVIWIEKQVPLIRQKRSLWWNDPLYEDMWHITRASRGEGFDMNVLEAWDMGYSGKGIVLTVMDDGLDYNHTDIRRNYDPLASTDINGGDSDPMPDFRFKNNNHGTRCAGQIASEGNNSVCIVGIAYNSRIGGIRMLDGSITDKVEAQSVGFNNAHIHIYSGSWGPEDTGKQYEGPGVLAQSAFRKGITLGRNGFGNVYIWASGNGGVAGDSCACDGYASSPFTLSVGGVSEHNDRPWYLEQCASTLVTTYSSGDTKEKMIASIDPHQKCTKGHTGTSASAPIAAAIIALLLEANPRLSWRDVQYVTLMTANPQPFVDGQFTVNAVGRVYSQLYGYGLMDAGKMVHLGKLWLPLPPRHQCTSQIGSVNQRLKDIFNHTFSLEFKGCQPVIRQDGQTFTAYSGSVKEEGEPVEFLEHVEMYADITYGRRGLLQISLISPSGTLTILQPPRIPDDHSGNIGLLRWPVSSVQLWGEKATGTWQIRIDNEAGLSSYKSWQRPKAENYQGFWKNVWFVMYGTNEFPIRLRPPLPDQAPPAEWFKSFSKYLVQFPEWNVVFTCHPECAPGGCTGPGADQCLGGCLHFATQNRHCVRECPLGTTPYDVLRISLLSQGASNLDLISSQNHRKRVRPSRTRSRNLRSTTVFCQPCWTLCAACVRPHTEYDCTACSNGRFLVPLIGDSKRLDGKARTLKTPHWKVTNIELPTVIGTCRSECPTGFYPNKTSAMCHQCVDRCARCRGPNRGDCTMCETGFRLIHGRCVDGFSVDGRCPPGHYLVNSQCVGCSPGCADEGCLANGQCTRCKPDYRYLMNSTCVRKCPRGWFAGSPVTGPYRVGGGNDRPRQCLPCQPGCQSCTSFDSCESCVDGLQLEGDLCVTTNRTSKQVCNRHCATCFSTADNCLTCPVHHPLLATRIMDQIHGRFDLLRSLITRHINSTTAEPTTSTVTAEERAETQVSPYTCPSVCPHGTFTHRTSKDRTVCRLCQQPCAICSNESHCLVCWPPFYLEKESSTCVLGQFCRHSEYYDVNKRQCTACNPACDTCAGSTASDCTSCKMNGPKPSCLSSQRSILREQLWRPEVRIDLNKKIFVGKCLSCCAFEMTLTNQVPSDCMFCVSGRLNCLSGTEINAGEGLVIDSEVQANLVDDERSWFISEPMSMVLLIIGLLVLFATVVMAVHCLRISIRRRRRLRLLVVRQRRLDGLGDKCVPNGIAHARNSPSSCATCSPRSNNNSSHLDDMVCTTHRPDEYCTRSKGICSAPVTPSVPFSNNRTTVASAPTNDSARPLLDIERKGC